MDDPTVTSYGISIHALLAESDLGLWPWFEANADFYPRSPCGERLRTELSKEFAEIISIHALLAESDGLMRQLSPTEYISIHALLAESDNPLFFGHRTISISIHALLAESDCSNPVHRFPSLAFLSTLSLRRATRFFLISKVTVCISIHALLAESDPGRPRSRPVFSISIHALLAESDHGSHRRGHGSPISIHALLAESDKSAVSYTCR